MLRKLAAVALCATSLVVASDKQTTVASRYLMAHCQKHNVTHDKNGFKVNGQRLLPYDIDPSLRDIRSLQQLKGSKLLVNGARYKLERHQQLNGGGVIGATLGGWFGYGAVNGVAQGAVYAVCLPIYAFNPALGYVINAGAAAVVNALVQPVAITAAVGCAIAGGVATGPV